MQENRKNEKELSTVKLDKPLDHMSSFTNSADKTI